jgi:predicted MFS family arabinose efflux permease
MFRYPPSVHQPALPIYAMLFTMQCARSMYIVLVSWFALQISGDVASVGKILVCWQLLAFTVGPFLGPLIDRSSRRIVFAFGEMVHGSGIILLALIAWFNSPDRTPIFVLYTTACFVSVGSLLSYPSSQALLQTAGVRRLTQTVSLGIFSGQVGNIVGAAIGGLCLAHSSLAGSLAICGAFSLASAAVALLFKSEDGATPVVDSAHLQDMIGGLRHTVKDPRLRLAGCALLLAYASAHASNALLAGFARYDLKLPSQLYGWLAAMYSGGGLIGSVVLASRSGVAKERITIAAGTVLLAAATAAFSTSHSMAAAMLWQGVIGLSFMMVRAGSDVTILKSVASSMVGRVRSNIDATIGLVAIFVYLLPTLTSGVSARHIFLALACVFACGSAAILSMQCALAAAERIPSRRQPGGLGAHGERRTDR